MRKTWKKALALVMSFAMTVSCFSGFATEVKAAETGEVVVEQTADGITIGNGYISRKFSTAGNKVSTVNITNKRTDGGDTVFTPGEGSEEFIIKLTKDATASAPVSLPGLATTNWTAKADSYHNAEGANDGPAQNLLDGNVNSIWHSAYDGVGQTSDETYPHNVVINMGEEVTFKSFSYTPRQQGEATNGNILGYELWASSSTTELGFGEEGWTQIAKGEFVYNGVNPIYVNLAAECTATQVKLVATSSNNGAKFAGGAEFNLHADAAPVDANTREFAASDLTLADVAYEATTATINNIAKSGVKLTFTFAPFEFKGVTYDITENIVMYDGDHFMRKYMEIDVDDKTQAIDYIDLESFKVNSTDAQWTIPTDAGGVVQMDRFKANLGQPIYIQGMFFGCEFPQADTQIVNGTGYMRYYTGKTFERFEADNQLTTDGTYVTWQTVAGAARSTEQQVIQSDFFEYIYSIATPSEFRIQYNSWFDNMMLIDDENILSSFIEIDRELNKAETRPLDSYVVDDGWNNYNRNSVVDAQRSGTTLNTTGFWEFNSKFPEGLTPSSELVQKFGSNFGVWIGPRGGYNFYGTLADILAENRTGSKAGGSIDVADRVYVENFKDMACQWQDEYNVNYWKWDGFADSAQYNAFTAVDGVPGYANNHMTGGYQHMYHVTDLWEAWIDLMEAVRVNAAENNIPKLWISLTCYVTPSPWFLQWANSVWIQCTHDQKDAGFGTTKMNKQITYRDAIYYDFLVNHEFQFPLANIYNHDPIYGVEGTGMNINTATDEEFQNYLYMLATRGTAFWELYFSDSIMTDGKYEVTGEFLAWAEENQDILKNAKMIGGMPDQTYLANASSNEAAAQAYGFSCFDGTDGIISLRNPHSSAAKDITFTLDRTMGISEDAGTVQYHLEHSYNLTEGTETTGTLEYGQTYTATLQPNEVRILRISKDGDQTAPKMVRAFSDGDKEITVKFDEKVTGTVFQVANTKVAKVELGPDDTTYRITLAEAPENGAEITVAPVTIYDLAGNIAENALSFTYNAGNAAEFVSGNNGFTVSATVGAATRSVTAPAGTLVAQGDSYELAVNDEGKATFTLNGTTAVSDVTVAVGDTVVGVKENNGMQKLYVNGELSGSAYSEENRYYEVKAAELTVVNASAASVFDIAYGYDTVADATEEPEEVLANVKLTGLTATASATDEGSVNNLFDGDPTTFWASPSVSAVAVGNPNVVVDLGGTYTINQIDYSPRFYNGAANYWHCTGNIKKLVLEVSTDGNTWTAVTPDGGLDISSKIVNTNDRSLFPHAVTFAPVEASYVRISATETYHWQAANVNKVMAVGDVAVYKVGEAEVVEPEATNIALGKTVAAKYTATNSNSQTSGDRPLSMAVDGTKNTNNYGEFGKDNERASQYFQVDLGKVCDIETVNLYRYWNDGRTYGDTVVAIAETEADFAAGNATIIYNADDANVHGLGAGSDADYAESSSGKSWNAPEGTTGRYVRVYTYGVKNGGTTNHIVELEVMGFEPEDPVVTGDLTALIDRLVELTAIDTTIYTDESVAAFEAALEPAFELVATGADQDVIDAMVASLADVESLLVEKEVTPDPTPEVTPDPTPEVTPDPTPEVTPDPTPEVTPDPTPEVTPDPTPDPTPTPDPDDSEHGEGNACVDFKDVTHGAWYEEEVQFVYDAGLMSGNDGLFNPSGNVTRAQVVTTLYRLAGEPKVSDYSACDDLVDVEAGKWYTNAVCWAYSTGVTTGDTTTKKFNMDTAVTRQQLASFFFRYADYMGLDTEARGDVSSMLNANQVSSYAKDAVEWAVGTGLISGSETPGANGETLYDLKPKATATRAQLAAILQRFCEN